MPFLHERPDWPRFRWDSEVLAPLLAEVRHEQGRHLGRMGALGFGLRAEATVESLTSDVVKSWAIEGERLDSAEVRSSIARRMGLDAGGLPPAGREVEGIVAMMLDATRRYAAPLTAERLFAWHGALFPTGRSRLERIVVGAWRSADADPMQVVSGPLGRERVHFQAPIAARVEGEMRALLDWLAAPPAEDPVLVAGLAHLWFVTIHPFEDGNGRIGRALTDMLLARADRSAERFYSLSAQIESERKQYYAELESAQRGDLDVTGWLQWFLACLGRAIGAAEESLGAVLRKARFWERAAGERLADRQVLVLNRLLDGFQGHLTSSEYAKLARCSADTAQRDIRDLVRRGLLLQNPGGGRSTSYRLAEPGAESAAPPGSAPTP